MRKIFQIIFSFVILIGLLSFSPVQARGYIAGSDLPTEVIIARYIALHAFIAPDNPDCKTCNICKEETTNYYFERPEKKVKHRFYFTEQQNKANFCATLVFSLKK